MNGVATHGMWSDGKRKRHINGLELKAALFGIQWLCRDLQHCHIRIHVDRISATWVVGTHSLACNAVTPELLLWCKARSIWLSTCHIAGKDTSAADSYSRKTSIHTEWSLTKALFAQLCSHNFVPHLAHLTLIYLLPAPTINSRDKCPYILILTRWLLMPFSMFGMNAFIYSRLSTLFLGY